ncbi:Serpentine Receptor, class H [Caenorhabditis elegans]|uniref:Serpentine Receptor, class H n=1 Tax=Caenorhabditis elegans TaxID=6239 RepID=Q9NAN5_CAEEL|nr:Serpentine Receptor, class H [Caenorhabditis elegans]CAB76413.2 Serpentine Receptor, class H [Caenorhabditis elegans]|eukprot:NP_496206.2 Serpentine Receptor, class H [Caenorhabditis elegans]
MQASCPTLSFFHSPKFLQISLHIISAVGIPIYIFGGYCILCKTPNQMNLVKLVIFNLHFWSTLMDLFMGLFVAPFILLPSMSGFPMGLLGYLDVNIPFQIYVMLTVIVLTGVAILHIFENRYNTIIFEFSSRKVRRALFFIFNYLLAFTFVIPTILRIPNQSEAIKIVKEQFPCEVDENRFFVLALDVRVTHYSVIITSSLIEGQIIYFVIRLLMNLSGKDDRKSERTRNLQKRLFRAICIQVTIPVLLMFIPFLFVIIQVSLEYHNQAQTNISLCLLSLHGLISTIVMLIVHKPYRDATLNILAASKLFQKNTNNNSEPTRNSVPFLIVTT